MYNHPTMQYSHYINLVFSPVIALLLAFYLRQHRNAGFITKFFQSFFAGMAASALLLGALWLSGKLGISELRNLKRTVFFSFVTIAASAEFGKFIVLRYFLSRDKNPFMPFDTILLSMNVSLGFTSTALLFFSFNIFNSSLYLPINLFSIAYIPANLIFSVVIGFFTGMAGFLRIRFMYSLTGLVFAVIFHAVFTFCILTRDYRLLSLFAFGSTIIVFVLAVKAMFAKPEDQVTDNQISE